MIENVTAMQVRQSMIANNITAVDHHDCSICGYMTHYVRNGETVYFNPGCYCRASELRPSSFALIADWINMQTNPDVKLKLAQRFGLAVTV